MLRLALILICCLALAAPAWAGWDEGVAAYKRGDYETALREFRPLAEQGDARAQTNLGDMYADGRGVAQDYAEALKWYRLAAEQGDAHTQANLGVMYAEGQGVARDDAEAVKWFRLAAELGDAYAQTNLGVMYAEGLGVAQDYVQAHMWLTLAGAQGLESAAESRDIVVGRMTPAQVAEAERLARAWRLETRGPVE